MVMKDRILTGWNYQRTFYLLAGLLITIVSILDQQWIGVAMGSYFTAMGLFGFGCAAGKCIGNSCNPDPSTEDHKI